MRIENTSDRQYDVNSLPKGHNPDGSHFGVVCYSIPRATMGPGEIGRVNGVGEIPDDVLAELLAKDSWSKAVFDIGHLVAVNKKSSSPPDKSSK